MPGALVWAALAFFSDFIPRIGGYVMAAPPMIIALGDGPMQAFWVGIFYLASNEILGSVVAPKIRGETMAIHPVGDHLLHRRLRARLRPDRRDRGDSGGRLRLRLLQRILHEAGAPPDRILIRAFVLAAALLRRRRVGAGAPFAGRASAAAGPGRAIGEEVSGSMALRTVRALSQHHRMRGSTGYRAAAESIRDRLREYGLQNVEIISLPADGRIFYGTQRSRPGWNASFAELWEQRRDGERWVDAIRIASWAEQPISLAQDSVSGRAEAELVDVGAGHERGGLCQSRRARPARPHLVAAGGGRRSRHRARRGRHRLLGAEPAHRLVGRGREPGPLGPSRNVRRSPDLRLHGLARPRPRLAGAAAARARRCGCARRSMPAVRPAPI